MSESIICKKNKCTGCGLCAEICPSKCIVMKEDYDGFFYPNIDKTKCIQCELCKKKCPNNSIIKKNKSEFYMAINKDEDVLKRSSSGGAFSAIANSILKDNGIIIGATFDKKNFKVKHIAIENSRDLDLLRLSKYFQSETNGIYKKTLEYLKSGKKVLFSGTACQIAALYSIIPRKFWENLVTVDVLCHGVSSKKIVDLYIKSEEKKHKKKIIDYKFRIKHNKDGWKSGSKMQLFFEDGSNYIEEDIYDAFFLTFNKNVILRKSCYECNYCGTDRISDFTIADFWGVSNKRATEDEKKYGISLLICNSPKSQKMLDNLKNELKITKIDASEAIPFNKALVVSNSIPKEREEFFNRINKNIDFIKVTKQIYWKNYLKNKIKKFIGYKNINRIKKIIRK